MNVFKGFSPDFLDTLAQRAMDSVRKADTIGTGAGIVAYDLEPKLKGLVPTLFPFIQRCPRSVSTKGGTATNWKALTGINTGNLSLGVSEGNRNANLQIAVTNYAASYKTLGMEADLTFEADEAAENFDDARAQCTDSLLYTVRIGEEKVALFGNGDSTIGVALGTPAAPTLTNNGGGTGTVPAATYYAYLVALTYEGVQNSTVAGGVATTITRTNVDGSSDTFGAGSSNVSAASATVTLGSAGSLKVSWAAIRGAFGYAVYVGTSAATAVLAGIVTNATSLVLTAAPAGTQASTAITADNSLNALEYTGLLPQCLKGGTGAYVQSLGGASLTSDGASGLNEIDAALESMYDNYRTGPHCILLNSYDHKQLSKLILANGGAPLVRFTAPAVGGSGNGFSAGGPLAVEYYNKFTGEQVKLETHPYMTKGMMFGYAERLSPAYMMGDVPVPFKIVCRSKDWYEIEWPLVTRRWQHGQYLSSLMKVYAPFAAFAITEMSN